MSEINQHFKKVEPKLLDFDEGKNLIMKTILTDLHFRFKKYYVNKDYKYLKNFVRELLNLYK